MKNSTKKAVLFITFDGLTDPLGQSQILPYLKGLSHDHQIHIISCEKSDAFDKNNITILNLIKGEDIHWHHLPYKNTPPIIGSWILQRNIQKLAKQIILKYNIQLLHCRSYPASIIGMKLSQNHHIPFVFDMRGFWPDERVDGNSWNLKNPLYRALYWYFKRMEKKLLANSKKIIVLTYQAKEILNQKFGVAKSKVEVIPCAADLNFFKNPGASIRDKLRLELQIHPIEKVLVYVGSVGTFYLIDEVLDLYFYLKKKYPIRLVFFSPEHSHQEIKNMFAKRGTEYDDVIIKFLKRQDLVNYLSIADFSAIFIKPSFSKQASSPTKHGELISMRIPSVVNKNVGDMEQIVNERPTGYVLKEFSEIEFENAWNYLLNTQFKSDDFDYIAHKYYSLDEGVKKYMAVYQSCL